MEFGSEVGMVGFLTLPYTDSENAERDCELMLPAAGPKPNS